MSDLHVVFQVGGGDYAIPAAQVVVMESFSGATAVPSTPSWVRGLVQIRGEVVPVVDLRARFGLDALAGQELDHRVVVVREGQRRVGLLVERAREVLRIGPETFRAPPEVVSNDSEQFVRAVAQHGERLIMLIDVGRILSGVRTPGGGGERVATADDRSEERSVGQGSRNESIQS